MRERRVLDVDGSMDGMDGGIKNAGDGTTSSFFRQERCNCCLRTVMIEGIRIDIRIVHEAI